MKTLFVRLLLFLTLAALLPACKRTSPIVAGPTSPPGLFDLTFPPNAQTNVSLSPSFSWTAAADVSSYTFQISTVSSFTTLLLEQQNILTTGVSPSLSLGTSTQYFWRVVAINSVGSRAATSAPFSFTTLPPPPGAFDLSTPFDGQTGVSLTPTFTWSASSNSVSYTFQISTVSSFTTILLELQNVLTTTLSPSLSLTNSTQYFWRIIAINPAGSRTATSAPFSFTTLAPPPSPPGPFTLTAPGNLATGVPRIPTFTWGAASGAVSYTIQVSTSNTFATFVVNQSSVSTTSFRCPVLLGSSTVYYWQVIAVNIGGPTLATGAPFSFTTASTPPGSLDTSLGTAGKAFINMSPGGANCHSMVIQPDGKIVVAGSAGNGVTPAFAVARLNDDGSFDTTFNGTGFVIAQMGVSGEDTRGVALQSDGKIVVAGFANFGGVYKFAVLRVNPDGSLDSTFGTGGRVITALGDGGTAIAEAVVVQADGKIVVGGYAVNSGVPLFALVRYNVDGTLDTKGFGTNGITLTIVTTDSNDYLFGLALQADQKLVAVGQTLSPLATNIDSVVVRYKTDGTLDTTGFGTGGIARVPAHSTNNDSLSAVAIQPDQKILVSGWVENANGFDHDVTLMRLTTAGVLDTTFNTTGLVTTSIDVRQDEGRSIAIQGDGKIVVAALATRADTSTDFAVLRYGAAGSLDTTFNGTGIVRTAVGAGSSDARAVAIDALGRIVVAGNGTATGSEGDAVVVRYWP